MAEIKKITNPGNNAAKAFETPSGTLSGILIITLRLIKKQKI